MSESLRTFDVVHVARHHTFASADSKSKEIFTKHVPVRKSASLLQQKEGNSLSLRGSLGRIRTRKQNKSLCSSINGIHNDNSDNSFADTCGGGNREQSHFHSRKPEASGIKKEENNNDLRAVDVACSRGNTDRSHGGDKARIRRWREERNTRVMSGHRFFSAPSLPNKYEASELGVGKTELASGINPRKMTKQVQTYRKRANSCDVSYRPRRPNKDSYVWRQSDTILYANDTPPTKKDDVGASTQSHYTDSKFQRGKKRGFRLFLLRLAGSLENLFRQRKSTNVSRGNSHSRSQYQHQYTPDSGTPEAVGNLGSSASDLPKNPKNSAVVSNCVTINHSDELKASTNDNHKPILTGDSKTKCMKKTNQVEQRCENYLSISLSQTPYEVGHAEVSSTASSRFIAQQIEFKPDREGTCVSHGEQTIKHRGKRVYYSPSSCRQEETHPANFSRKPIPPINTLTFHNARYLPPRSGVDRPADKGELRSVEWPMVSQSEVNHDMPDGKDLHVANVELDISSSKSCYYDCEKSMPMSGLVEMFCSDTSVDWLPSSVRDEENGPKVEARHGYCVQASCACMDKGKSMPRSQNISDKQLDRHPRNGVVSGRARSDPNRQNTYDHPSEIVLSAASRATSIGDLNEVSFEQYKIGEESKRCRALHRRNSSFVPGNQKPTTMRTENCASLHKSSSFEVLLKEINQIAQNFANVPAETQEVKGRIAPRSQAHGTGTVPRRKNSWIGTVSNRLDRLIDADTKHYPVQCCQRRNIRQDIPDATTPLARVKNAGRGSRSREKKYLKRYACNMNRERSVSFDDLQNDFHDFATQIRERDREKN